MRIVLPQRFRFSASLGIVYGITAVFALICIQPGHWLDEPKTVALTKVQQIPLAPVHPKITTIAGRPVRIVIADSGIDLPIDPGYYDTQTDEWTLSGYHAQFAMLSSLANNQSGNTFIYGHNNNYVFGALRHNAPQPGSEALLYTDNGHVFAYKFEAVTSLTPNDTSTLSYQGPAVMTIQTCTGSVNEWRTMFRYSFEKVVQ